MQNKVDRNKRQILNDHFNDKERKHFFVHFAKSKVNKLKGYAQGIF